MKHALIACALFSVCAAGPAFAEPAFSAPNAVTEQELRAFTEARAEIAALYPAPPYSDAQSAALTQQIYIVLERHDLTAARYNAIDEAISADADLAAHMAALAAGDQTGV